MGANDYRVKMRSKTKAYHVNALKKYIAREPEVDVHTSSKDDASIAVARVVHQDTDPELWEIPDLEVKLGEDLSEGKQCILKDLICMKKLYEETDVIQHRVKLKDNTPICCKPYALPWEELWNEVDSMLEMVSNRVSVDYRKLNKIIKVDPEPMMTAEDLFRRPSGKK